VTDSKKVVVVGLVRAAVHAALDAGVRLIDTALAYTRADVESYAEQIVARALREVTGERPLVATKGDTGATATPSPSTADRTDCARTARSACARSGSTRSICTSFTT
jgi:aryl-alcohol dehydrogenase-like predicted oxidoreductase